MYSLSSIIRQVIQRSFTLQGTMERCPFTNLCCYMPSKFKAMEKAAFLSAIHSEQDNEAIVIQDSFMPKLATNFYPYQIIFKSRKFQPQNCLLPPFPTSHIKRYMTCVCNLTLAQVNIIINILLKGILRRLLPS